MQPVTENAAMLGGFVAGEACFVSKPLETKTMFAFVVGLGASDEAACEWLAATLGCGRTYHYKRRRPHYDDEVRFQVRKMRDLVERVVPFMDEHLPPSHKREQYLVWRAELIDYWELRARRPRPCSIEGCPGTAVAHGRCHNHDMAWRRRARGSGGG